jgi:hypothetical protein
MATAHNPEMTIEKLQGELNDFFGNDQSMLEDWLQSHHFIHF